MSPPRPYEIVPNRPPTPPHHPTYGVRLTDKQITSLVENAHPDLEVTKIEQLPSGKSFNNRIYFISATTRSSDHATATPDQNIQLILKLSGRFFGPEKVQNEVAALTLLEERCPSIPVPRVWSWSDGEMRHGWRLVYAREIDHELGIDRRKIVFKEVPTLTEYSTAENKHIGWLLTERLPGRPMSADDLRGPQTESLLHELVHYVATWRMISSPVAGNLRLYPKQDVDDTADTDRSDRSHPRSVKHISTILASPGDLAMIIDGLLLRNYFPGSHDPPITSRLSYYCTIILDQLEKVKREDVFAHTRAAIVRLIEEDPNSLLQYTLCRLSLFADSKPVTTLPQSSTPSSEQEEEHVAAPEQDPGPDPVGAPFIFTHYDLSPRNILVSTSSSNSLNITGLVDFEFAGFFPPEEEFTNTEVNNGSDPSDGDWVDNSWGRFLNCLESAGVKDVKNRTLKSHEEWEQAKLLVRINEDVAPWWLREGGIKGEELEAALDTVLMRLRGNVERLKAMTEAVPFGGGQVSEERDEQS